MSKVAGDEDRRDPLQRYDRAFPADAGLDGAAVDYVAEREGCCGGRGDGERGEDGDSQVHLVVCEDDRTMYPTPSST